MPRTIYNLILNENASTFFEIKDDGNMYIQNRTNGVLQPVLRYIHLLNMSSNMIILANPDISAEEWETKFATECEEFIDDIADLPIEYKLKALEEIQSFKKIYSKVMRQKVKAMNKAGIDETINGNKLEGVRVNIETGIPVCYTCGEPKKLLRCSRCCNIAYCSKECSHADWKRHKPNCISK